MATPVMYGSSWEYEVPRKCWIQERPGIKSASSQRLCQVLNLLFLTTTGTPRNILIFLKVLVASLLIKIEFATEQN